MSCVANRLVVALSTATLLLVACASSAGARARAKTQRQQAPHARLLKMPLAQALKQVLADYRRGKPGAAWSAVRALWRAHPHDQRVLIILGLIGCLDKRFEQVRRALPNAHDWAARLIKRKCAKLPEAKGRAVPSLAAAIARAAIVARGMRRIKPALDACKRHLGGDTVASVEVHLVITSDGRVGRLSTRTRASRAVVKAAVTRCVRAVLDRARFSSFVGAPIVDDVSIALLPSRQRGRR